MAKEKRTSGQPQKYGSVTRILSIRVPKLKYDHYREVFRNFLKVEESVNSNNNIT